MRRGAEFGSNFESPEERAALMRIANDEHKSVRILPSDTIMFSSSIVPGNERTVQRLKDTLPLNSLRDF